MILEKSSSKISAEQRTQLRQGMAEFLHLGGIILDEEMMKLTVRKYRGETSVVSARLPGDLVAELDKVAKATGRTRNDVVQKCLEFAIERIEIEEK